MQAPTLAVLLPSVFLATSCYMISGTDAFPQVLPPIPGYIPVFIHHGDVPPEDVYEFSQLFQKADQNIPPYVPVTKNELDNLRRCLAQDCLVHDQTNQIELSSTPEYEESTQISTLQTENDTDTSKWLTENKTGTYTETTLQ